MMNLLGGYFVIPREGTDRGIVEMMQNLMTMAEEHVIIMIFLIGRSDSRDPSYPSHCLRQMPRCDKILGDHRI